MPARLRDRWCAWMGGHRRSFELEVAAIGTSRKSALYSCRSSTQPELFQWPDRRVSMRFSRMAGGIVLIVASASLAQEPTPSTYSKAIPQSLHGPFVSDP